MVVRFKKLVILDDEYQFGTKEEESEEGGVREREGENNE